MLASTEGHPGEQESIKNFGLRNMKYVQVIKNVVEKACPGVVSCADILILSGRDGIAMVYILSLFLSFFSSRNICIPTYHLDNISSFLTSRI